MCEGVGDDFKMSSKNNKNKKEKASSCSKSKGSVDYYTSRHFSDKWSYLRIFFSFLLLLVHLKACLYFNWFHICFIYYICVSQFYTVMV